MSFAGATEQHPFAWTFDGAMGFMNIGLVLFSGLVCFILNDINRLVAVPLVTSACNALGAGFGYHAWDTGLPDEYIKSRQVTAVLCEIFYKFATLSLNLYSFFLLEKILPRGRRRTVFLTVFALLFITLTAFVFSTVPIVLRFKTRPDKLQETGHLLDKLNYGDYITRALLELWCAYFLLKTFSEARKGSRDLGRRGHNTLFRDLMRSSELRVSSLVILSMIKLTTYRTEEDVGVVLSGIAQWEFATTNLFSVLFLIDVIAARMSKLQSSMESMMGGGRAIDDKVSPSGISQSTGSKMLSTTQSSEIGNYIQTPPEVSRRYLGSATGTGAVDSLREEYSHYGLANWGGNRLRSLPTQWQRKEGSPIEERDDMKADNEDIEKCGGVGERIMQQDIVMGTK